MIYRAAAALPDDDRQSAVDGLRGQLRIMAVAAGATPDWTTLVVAGPVEMAGAEDRTRFEWTASVAARGATVLDDLTSRTRCHRLASSATPRWRSAPTAHTLTA